MMSERPLGRLFLRSRACETDGSKIKVSKKASRSSNREPLRFANKT